jgi:hypothetical protein
MHYHLSRTQKSPVMAATRMRLTRKAVFFALCCLTLFFWGCASAKNRGETPTEGGGAARGGSGGGTPVRHILADAGLSIVLPADLATVTRTELNGNFLAYKYINQTILDAAGLDLPEIRRFMRESRIWLYALDGGHLQEIILVAYPQEGRDYDGLSDEELINIAFSREMENALRGQGASGRVYSTYRSGGGAWIILDIEQAAGNQTLHASEYYTVKNRKAYSIILQNTGSPLSAEQYALLKNAVDSITFDP